MQTCSFKQLNDSTINDDAVQNLDTHAKKKWRRKDMQGISASVTFVSCKGEQKYDD